MGTIAKRDTLNLRIKPDERSLIDRAAQSLGKNRTDFILDAARRAAEEGLDPTFVSPGATLGTSRENSRVVSALPKRSFGQHFGLRLERLGVSCCKIRLSNPFEWQQVCATGLTVGFWEDSAMTPHWLLLSQAIGIAKSVSSETCFAKASSCAGAARTAFQIKHTVKDMYAPRTRLVSFEEEIDVNVSASTPTSAATSSFAARPQFIDRLAKKPGRTTRTIKPTRQALRDVTSRI
jgi:Protein of unknown function (DUF1778)